MRPALIVIDVTDFVYGKLKYERALEIILNLKRPIEKFRRLGLPIICVSDFHLPVDPEIKM
jgi:nicotinamidase-related amidase